MFTQNVLSTPSLIIIQGCPGRPVSLPECHSAFPKAAVNEIIVLYRNAAQQEGVTVWMRRGEERRRVTDEKWLMEAMRGQGRRLIEE
ncbi:hypothetical protein PBY51_009011 [Eleginops maclovinus]|uniref:Uncharacterized protein n=1 Tax=Eleginops maclovinus TaxID=56733 RepID=A0AAN7WI16_ELEMC|nr:hypothetical protein PBY51_009011 [Eleginops maclovinus]